ncbi:MAG: polynucleotide adenylyltransferase PcnB [Legionellaceae bacterium]|nr:polynucleotide adenylyltransferase PcnB [Legionellaceae bacterium]
MLKRSPRRATSIDAKYCIARSRHSISKTDISDNALKVLNRLNSAGYEAYLVGGSVRDLLVRKAPKDFDVTTNATPNQIKKLFRNARIIGRRFKLVHILFHRDVIEVATFRASQEDDEQQKVNETGMLVRDNVYGTAHDDAWRRDFTINALFYDIQNSTIIDLTGGFDDIKAQIIRIIGDAEVRYKEDPVRMLRAIRFAAKLHFSIEPDTAKPLKKLSAIITHVSPSRLFDEMTKLYQCGEAKAAHHHLQQYGIFSALFPQVSAIDPEEFPVQQFIATALENTDRRIHEEKPVNPAFLFAVFLWFPLLQKQRALIAEGCEPLPALEQAMSSVLSTQSTTISIPKRFSLVIREIWLLQYRFTKRITKKPFQLLAHPRFRAAYDFLAIRALAGNETMELADWWTRFQEVEPTEQQNMIRACETNTVKKKRRRRRRPATTPSSSEE